MAFGLILKFCEMRMILELQIKLKIENFNPLWVEFYIDKLTIINTYKQKTKKNILNK